VVVSPISRATNATQYPGLGLARRPRNSHLSLVFSLHRVIAVFGPLKRSQPLRVLPRNWRGLAQKSAECRERLHGDFLPKSVALGSKSHSCIQTIRRSPTDLCHCKLRPGDNVQDRFSYLAGPAFRESNAWSEREGHGLLLIRQGSRYAETDKSV